MVWDKQHDEFNYLETFERDGVPQGSVLLLLVRIVEFDQSMEIGREECCSTPPEHVEIYPTRSSFERQKAGGLER
jgi:hypothetical protein